MRIVFYHSVSLLLVLLTPFPSIYTVLLPAKCQYGARSGIGKDTMPRVELRPLEIGTKALVRRVETWRFIKGLAWHPSFRTDLRIAYRLVGGSVHRKPVK